MASKATRGKAATKAKAPKGSRVSKVIRTEDKGGGRTPRTESKLAQLIEALRTREGISIVEAAERFN